MAAAKGRLAVLAQRARSHYDFAAVTRLQVTPYATVDRSDRAIEVFLDYLRRIGTNWAPRSAREDVNEEYKRTCASVWPVVIGYVPPTRVSKTTLPR